MKKLSILITSKDEPLLDKTVADIKEHAETDVEILVGDDGKEQIGHRAMLNKLAKQATGSHLMKLDAHCSIAQGMDRVLLEDCGISQIMSPLMMPLDTIGWRVQHHSQMAAFGFDTNLVVRHMPVKGDAYINKVMGLQGSCFITRIENWWDWNLCDESLGSWGGQGAELGIKAFLNGGECVTNRRTYYGHEFRHGEKDFPYKRDMDVINKSLETVKNKLKTRAIIPLIEEFDYPFDWNEQECAKIKE